MRRASSLVAVVLLVACRTAPPPPPAPSAASTSAPALSSTPPAVSAPPAASAVRTGSPLARDGCRIDADCTLSAVSSDCCACDLDREHPVLARAVTQHEAQCATASCALDRQCPAPTRYDRAFFRAECHAGKCELVRWHSGG